MLTFAFMLSSLPCLYTFWHAIPTSFYIFNVFKSCIYSIIVRCKLSLSRFIVTASVLVLLWLGYTGVVSPCNGALNILTSGLQHPLGSWD